MKTLVLVGHGSSVGGGARDPVDDHAEMVRQTTDRFDRVRPAFVKGDPGIGPVVGAIHRGTVVVVPMFASAGYFVCDVIPDEIEATRNGGTDLRYTPPVGTHGTIPEIIVDRIESVWPGGDGVAIALVGHGSERHPGSANAIRDHAAVLRRQQRFAEVKSCFLAEPPFVDSAIRTCETDPIVVVPVLMTEGTHVTEDIPRAIGLEDASGSVDEASVHYTDPIGTHPRVGEIALDRATAALDMTAGHNRRGTPPGSASNHFAQEAEK